jgi:hypothetical protein
MFASLNRGPRLFESRLMIPNPQAGVSPPMQDQEMSTTAGRSSKFSTGMKVLLYLAGLVLLTVAVVSILGQRALSEWERFVQEVRGRGEPLLFQEIEAARPRVADELNSALAVEPWLQELDKISSEEQYRVLGSRSAGGPDDWRAGTPRYLLPPSREFRDEHQDVLDGLEVLRGKTEGFLALPPTDNVMEVVFPSFASYRQGTKLLALDTRLDLIDGKPEAAAGNIELLLNLSETMDAHPTLIGFLVQIAMRAVAVNSVEQVVGVTEVDEETLAMWQARFSEMLGEEGLYWAMLGERAFLVEVFDGIAEGEISFSEISTGSGTDGGFGVGLLPNAVVRRSQLLGAQMHTRIIQVTNDPPKLLAESRLIEQEIEELGAFHLPLKILMPSLRRAFEMSVRAQALLKCAIAGVAAERYRLATGSLPDSLEALVPTYLEEVPIDPFTGNPMRFKQTEEGIVVYSVGVDGTDEGGLLYAKKNRGPHDVGFRVFKLEARGYPLTDEPDPEAGDAGARGADASDVEAADDDDVAEDDGASGE